MRLQLLLCGARVGTVFLAAWRLRRAPQRQSRFDAAAPLGSALAGLAIVASTTATIDLRMAAARSCAFVLTGVRFGLLWWQQRRAASVVLSLAALT